MKIMKKFLILTIIFCLPIYVGALTYNTAARNAKSYLSTPLYKDNYQRYLYDGNNMNLPFKYESGSITYDAEFANIDSIKPLGGLLNKDEFDLTKENASNISSYLYDGMNYWTMTKSGSSHYLIGKDKYVSDSESGNYGIRVTEFVQNETVVIGSGTRIDPWIFQPKYKVNVEAINGIVEYPASGQYVNKYGSIKLTLKPDSGQDYVHNDCGYNQETIKDAAGKVKELIIKDISNNINCTVVFGNGLYKLELVSTRNVEPKVIYAKFGEKFYSDSVGNIIFEKLTQIPSEDGYTLKGFDYKVSDTEKVKVIDSSGKVILSSTSKIKSDGYLYEDMTANQYTVNFDPNGGTVQPTSMQVTYHSKYGDMPVPVWSGHSFTGWYTTRTGGDLITNDNNVDILSTQTLYAHWEPGKYTVSFDCNGGTGKPDNQQATFGSTFTLTSSQCTKKGHTFKEWKDGNETVWTTSNTNNWTWNIPNDVVLTAQWNVNSYHCDAGKYLPADSTSCATCLANHYCGGGDYNFNASSNQGITACPTGYGCETGKSDRSNCYISVSAGRYIATSGASSSTQCSAGTYKAAHTVNYGSTSSCSACTGDTYSAAGAEKCTNCPSGKKANSNHTDCYKPTVNCRKWIPQSCSGVKWSGDACSVDSSRMNLCDAWGGYAVSSTGYNCLGQAATYWHCNWYDGCGCHNGGAYAFNYNCTEAHWDYKNNVSKCPSGYSEY